MKNNHLWNLSIACGLAAILFINFNTPASAAVGDCITDMVNVYDHACDTAETQSGQCTTRIESAPEAAWCCCDADYGPAVCITLFDGIFGSIGSAASNAMFISRSFRDGVLDRTPMGSEYIDLYYANTDNMIGLMIKHPELAKTTAKIFKANQQLLVDLAEGKQAYLKKESRHQVLNLLKAYAKAAGKDSELGEAVKRIHKDLESGESLKEFKVKLID